MRAHLIYCPFHTSGGQGSKPGRASTGSSEQSCQGLKPFSQLASEGELQQVSEMPHNSTEHGYLMLLKWLESSFLERQGEQRRDLSSAVAPSALSVPQCFCQRHSLSLGNLTLPVLQQQQQQKVCAEAPLGVDESVLVSLMSHSLATACQGKPSPELGQVPLQKGTSGTACASPKGQITPSLSL